jgi:small subunit ribosomal protein S18
VTDKASEIVRTTSVARLPRYAQRRAELKEVGRSPSSAAAEGTATLAALQRLPRDANWVFQGESRELAHRGELPCIRKARAAQDEPEQKRRRRIPALAGFGATIDYKDTQLLRTFISERGKIRTRRVTGLSPQQQRRVATAIRNARKMALLPYGAPL